MKYWKETLYIIVATLLMNSTLMSCTKVDIEEDIYIEQVVNTPEVKTYDHSQKLMELNAMKQELENAFDAVVNYQDIVIDYTVKRGIVSSLVQYAVQAHVTDEFFNRSLYTPEIHIEGVQVAADVANYINNTIENLTSIEQELNESIAELKNLSNTVPTPSYNTLRLKVAASHYESVVEYVQDNLPSAYNVEVEYIDYLTKAFYAYTVVYFEMPIIMELDSVEYDFTAEEVEALNIAVNWTSQQFNLD